MSNSIIRRKYYAVQLELVSPICVSGGEDYYTDADVLRDSDGVPFIPGSSLAGAFRNYLGEEKDQKGSMMGYSSGEDGRMSSLYISDLFFQEPENITVSVRDRVQLNDRKTVKNKFDMEIVETGAQGILYMEYILREKDKDDYEERISAILQGLQKGEIRIGANKNRGYGRIRITDIFQREFDRGTLEDWLEFQRSEREIGRYGAGISYEAWMQSQKDTESEYVKVIVPLELNGGISIRRYSTRPDQADFEHITCNGKPVIPGNSWNGAVRSAIDEILEELGCGKSRRNNILGQWFGQVEDHEKQQSLIVISESVIEGAAKLPMTRNKINRFDASTVDGGLYREIAYFGGKTRLEFMVRKDESRDYMALLGIMQYVIADMQKGYISVGGQTAVGRGIFRADESEKIYYSEELREKSCLEQLYSVVMEG